ncbi:hypothetical protein ASD91_08010 [Pseudomonas sp. Root68]|nr:hypothetical protein ASD91_08010 [Pseudomonas sp. Root68]KRB64757.1 hypothetical protein ASD95_13530 [Pseudomonas sp. Root71]
MEIATILAPLELQKLPHNNCSAGELAVFAIAPDIGMASMLNSTAKQAIQAIASRCRDMAQNPFGWAIRRGLFSLIRADK